MVRASKTLRTAFAMIFFGLGAVNVFAQAGGAAVPFLLISPNSRSNAMGDAGTGIADDINALYWNPGGLAYQDQQQASLSFSKWLPQFNADLYYSYAAYGQYVKSVEGYCTVSFILMNLGEFQHTGNGGEKLGTFSSNEFAIGASYSTKLSDNVGGGIQLRYIRSNLAQGVSTSGSGDGSGVGNSVSFDFGVLWKPKKMDFGGGFDLSDKIGLGVNLQNIGPSMKYVAQSDPLPTSLRLGLGITPIEDEFNKLTLAVDVSKLLVHRDSTGSDKIPKSFITAWKNSGVEFSTGIEYWYEKLVALRAGYFNEGHYIGDRRYFTFGAGVRYDIFGFDFSFINPVEQNHPLANTLRFTLMVDWAGAERTKTSF